jgi:hypothetical protein
MEQNSVQSFVSAKGKQKPEFYEDEGKNKRGILEESFAEGPFEQTGFTTTDMITNEEPIEVRSMAFPAFPKWWIEGKLLEGKEAIGEETTVTEPFKLNLEEAPVGPFTIVCKGVRVKTGNIEGPGARTEAAVDFEQCETEGKAECSVADTASRPLHSQLEGAPGAIKLKVEPEKAGEIVAFRVSHVTGEPPCKEEGSYRASGFMIGNYVDVATEATEHSLEFTATSGSDVIVKTKNGYYFDVGFTGTDTVHLTSGKLWSAFF